MHKRLRMSALNAAQFDFIKCVSAHIRWQYQSSTHFDDVSRAILKNSMSICVLAGVSNMQLLLDHELISMFICFVDAFEFEVDDTITSFGRRRVLNWFEFVR